MENSYQCPECEHVLTETTIRQFRAPPEQAWCPSCAGKHISEFVRCLTPVQADDIPRWVCNQWGQYEHDWLDCPDCIANYEKIINEDTTEYQVTDCKESWSSNEMESP